jgi:branched-chain amino acid transport system ATP-binding protein
LEHPDPVLDVVDVCVRYGSIPALEGIALSLFAREAVGVLGANGAGKTTLLNTLSGFLRPSAGRIEMGGRRIDGTAPHRIVRRGLLHVSQERDLFGGLSVADNLRLGGLVKGNARLDRNLERVFAYFPRLKERRTQRANTMSGGEQQMLAIGRALMAEPSVLLFDEPSAGLSPLFVDEIGNMVRRLKDEEGVSVILVEQNIGLAAKVVDRFLVLRAGQIVAQGSADGLRIDHAELARKFYL